MVYEVHLFGAIELRTGERVVGPRDFGGIKPKQIFELLVLARGGRVSKERLAEQLWDGALPQNVSATLETYVSVLRRVLATDGQRTPIVTERGAYRLDWSAFDLDLDRFDEFTREAPGTERRARRASLERAIDLAVGQVLEDEPYSGWALELRERYCRLLTLARIEAAELAVIDEDHKAAIRHAERAIDADALSEGACRALMVGQYALGRREEAIRVYQRCASALADDLDSNPDALTVQLHGAIQRREHWRVAARLTMDGFGGADADGVAPPRVGLPLLGRQDTLGSLTRLVEDANSRRFSFVLIEGERGSGKTRMLEELMSRLGPMCVGRFGGIPVLRDLPYVGLATALRQMLDRAGVDVSMRTPFAALLPEMRASDPLAFASELDALEAFVCLSRSHGPLAFVIDDLEHVDESSLRGLMYLRQRCSDVPGIIVATMTPTGRSGHAILRALRPDTTVELERLTRADVASVGGDRLWKRSGGLAVLVSALASSGGSRSPAIERWVFDRCCDAGTRVQRLLTVAACIEAPFSSEMVAALSGDDVISVSEDLERLCVHGLLRLHGSRFEVRDELIREIVAATVSPARRELLARRAAELTGRDPRNNNVGELAAWRGPNATPRSRRAPASNIEDLARRGGR